MAEKRHPLQDHTDKMREAADAVDSYFRDQVQMQGQAQDKRSAPVVSSSTVRDLYYDGK